MDGGHRDKLGGCQNSSFVAKKIVAFPRLQKAAGGGKAENSVSDW